MYCRISDKTASFCGYVNNYKTKTTCKQRSMASSLVQQIQAGGRTAQELKTALSLTSELSNKSYQTATPFQFLTLRHLRVLAFAGLNITGGRADGVMRWLVIVTGKLYCLFQLHNGFPQFMYAYKPAHISLIFIIVMHRCLSHINSYMISFTLLIYSYN